MEGAPAVGYSKGGQRQRRRRGDHEPYDATGETAPTAPIVDVGNRLRTVRHGGSPVFGARDGLAALEQYLPCRRGGWIEGMCFVPLQTRLAALAGVEIRFRQP